VPDYRRAATVGAHSAFIDGLAGLVRRAAGGEAVVTCNGGRVCPPDRTCCGFN